ncbi:M48 family metallopeptidase [Chitinophagaceae bacterium LB-8]|uniref:M48 family metallopeptidase n=1 Tax=Paraflavisolibacter caeni TaxID=2982496 RepID=A0A9X3BJ81_9BACT|nr:M48 family metallopeptidase [Paraflavisolibacter caeni]MCU7550838.1 M48 family metallopeptidase [Paraflavisolibacter caeni]
MVRNILTLFIVAATVISCSTNPVTGRSQFKLVSESELQAMATQEYRQFLSQNKTVSPSADKDAEMVRRVGQRLANALQSYYKQQGLSEVLNGYQWEFNLVNNKEANAWAMPGGKVVVYTGLLPITQNEAALANVLGHEISHAIFQHGNERMSQGLAQQLGGAALSVALSSKPAETQSLFMQAYGLGSQVGVLLPFSRKHELEADRYGMRWAALAGYNPREAIALWQRMEKMSTGSRPPEFLSTHPAEENRIAYLQKYLDEALQYYKPISK